MAYPFTAPTVGRKDVPAGPGKLWKRIPPDHRLEAVTSFWQEDEGSIEQQAEALMAIAQHYRFRPKSVRTMALDRKVKYLAALPAVSDAVAGRVLVAYHLAHQRPMLSAFLDALGIPHDNGVLNVEEMKAPEADRLKAAAETLRASFPADAVDLYFQTLLVQDPDTWGGLADLVA
jgi:hypothetical protein